MVIKKIISALLRAVIYPPYRKHIFAQIKKNLHQGSLFYWLRQRVKNKDKLILISNFYPDLPGQSQYTWLQQEARPLDRSRFQRNSVPFGASISILRVKVAVAVVVHVYYEDTWDEIAHALSALNMPFDLIITTTIEKEKIVSIKVKEIYENAEIYAFENKGRDIRPFIAVLPILIKREYEAVLKLHSKKSLHMGGGGLWRNTLISELLPTSSELNDILKSLNSYTYLGLIAPKGSVLSIDYDFESNKSWIERLVIESGESMQWLVQTNARFAAGTMFWFKPKSIQVLLECSSIQNDLFEHEEGQLDGTLAHAIERFIGIANLANGYHLVDTGLIRILNYDSKSQNEQ